MFKFMLEMVDFMKQAAMAKGELDSEQRNLLSIGYKNLIGERRSAWRVVNSKMSCETDKEKLSIINVSRISITIP